MSMIRTAVLAAAVFAFQDHASLAAPRIDGVSLRGLQIGAATTLVITGAELTPSPTIWLGDTAIEAAVKEGAAAERVELEIQLPKDSHAAFPGIRQLRVSNESGISNAVALVVDELPQSTWMPELTAWPVALSGSCDGATRLVTTLDGVRDQLLAVEVEARRLGSMLNPTIRVLDEQGVQIAWAQADSLLDGDARLAVTLPHDGKYQLELHDALFQGQPPAFFRVKIAKEAAPSTPFLRGMQVEELSLRSLTSLVDDATAANAWRPVRLERPSAAATGRLRLFVSPWREAVEDEDALLDAPLPAPIGINGRIGASQETDKYVVTAAPGETLRVECFAERANSPLDGVLTVVDAAGNQLAAGDDQPGTVDPGLEFTMPGEPVTLALRDLRHRGGDEFRYRLSVLPANQPGIRLTLDADRYLVPRNGVAILRAHVDRQGNDAAIKLNLAALPGGVVADVQEIPPGASDALVTLRGSADAQVGVVRVSGEALGLSPPATVEAQGPSTPVSRFSPWLAGEIAVSAAPAAPLTLAWSGDVASEALLLATNTTLGVQLERASGATGPVRLSLMTTQTPPMKQENNQNVPDLPRTLRLAQEMTIAADQNGAQVPIAVPADLSAIPYDLALKAELLSADGGQVVATAFSPSRRMNVAKPSFTLQMADAAAVAPAGDGQFNVELRGKVNRPAGFTQPVTVRVTGLPEGITAPQVIVPEGQTDFTLTVALPATLPLGDLRAAKLTATSELAAGIVINAANELAFELQLVVNQ